MRRVVAIGFCVLVLHVGFIYALYHSLLAGKLETVVPIVMLSQLIEPRQPAVAKLQPAPKAPPAPVKVSKASIKTPAVATPLPLAISDRTPAPIAPSGAVNAQTATLTIAAPAGIAVGAAAGVATQSAQPGLQMPSSAADYLQNPKPAYPAISRRLNEQGKTTIRVLIGADGLPQRAEIATSSGFSRLDEAALASVMRWRYVPGKRGGVDESMWFNVPINWVLE